MSDLVGNKLFVFSRKGSDDTFSFFFFRKFWTRNRPGDTLRDKYNLNTLPIGPDGEVIEGKKIAALFQRCFFFFHKPMLKRSRDLMIKNVCENLIFANYCVFHASRFKVLTIDSEIEKSGSLSLNFIRKTCLCNVYPPYTPLLYGKTGVCRGIPIFLIFDLMAVLTSTHNLCFEQK